MTDISAIGPKELRVMGHYTCMYVAIYTYIHMYKAGLLHIHMYVFCCYRGVTAGDPCKTL